MLHLTMNMPLYLMALYGSIMIAILLLLRFFLRERLPKFVFPLLWAVVIIRLLIPFSLSGPLSAPVPDFGAQPSRGSTTAEVVEDSSRGIGDALMSNMPIDGNIGNAATAGGISEVISEAPQSFPIGSTVIILLVLGGLAVLVILLLHFWRCTAKLRGSLPLEENHTVKDILRELGMEQLPVFSCDAISSPLVYGVLRPRIYLPTHMDFQNTTMVKHILTHEVMHIKRGDNLFKLFMLLTLCLNWYNPLVWLMSNCLSADLESACDAAVLKILSDGQRQSYASSLLSMAVSSSRSSLLYSAFSKTQVERRIKSVLRYRRLTALTAIISVAVVFCGVFVFATGGQAPFSAELSSYCTTDTCRWGVKATLTRGTALDDSSQNRADNVIFAVLKADTTGDPDIIAEAVGNALSNEFGLEKTAFHSEVYLSLSDEALKSEYAQHGLSLTDKGTYLFNGEEVRTYTDKLLGSVQTRNSGSVDVAVERDRLGIITEITALHEGDESFDKRTAELEKNRDSYYGVETFNTQASPITPQITAVPELSFTDETGVSLAIGMEQEVLRKAMGDTFETDSISSKFERDRRDADGVSIFYREKRVAQLSVSSPTWTGSLGISPGDTVSAMRDRLGEPAGTMIPPEIDLIGYCYLFQHMDGQYVLKQNPYQSMETLMDEVYKNTQTHPNSYFYVVFVADKNDANKIATASIINSNLIPN